MELMDETVSLTIVGGFGAVEIWGMPSKEGEKPFPLMVTNGKVRWLCHIYRCFSRLTPTSDCALGTRESEVHKLHIQQEESFGFPRI